MNLPGARADTARLPPTLPGFEHMKRMWDSRENRHLVRVQPGEVYVTNHDELITTVLGSCVAACIRDPRSGIGGMNHFMLPSEAPGESARWSGDLSAASRYGNYAMEHLINAIISHGGSRHSLEIKVFGGGRVLAAMTDIGRRNIEFIRHYLAMEGLKIVAEDLGDVYPRRVLYYPQSGRVRVKKLSSSTEIVREESRYRHQLEHQPVAGEIDLF